MDENLLKKLEERKKVYQKFLLQIEAFIEYAQDKAKNNES